MTKIWEIYDYLKRVCMCDWLSHKLYWWIFSKLLRSKRKSEEAWFLARVLRSFTATLRFRVLCHLFLRQDSKAAVLEARVFPWERKQALREQGGFLSPVKSPKWPAGLMSGAYRNPKRSWTHSTSSFPCHCWPLTPCVIQESSSWGHLCPHRLNEEVLISEVCQQHELHPM